MTDLRIIETRFKDHCDQNGKDFAAITLSIKTMSNKISIIKDNHLQHLKEDVSELKTDMSWVKKIQWFMATTIISNLIGVIYLILQK
jgi:hypothetical protein